jgi:hypothetical protein
MNIIKFKGKEAMQVVQLSDIITQKKERFTGC